MLNPFTCEKEETMESSIALSLLKTKFNSSGLLFDAQRRIDLYKKYLDYYLGDADKYMVREPGRHKEQVNLARRAVSMIAHFMMDEFPEVRVPRDSEIMAGYDISNKEIPKFYEEVNRAEALGKIIREKVLDETLLNVLECQNGLETGICLGDTVLYHPMGEKDVLNIQNIFPGHCRMVYSSSKFDRLQEIFIITLQNASSILDQYGVNEKFNFSDTAFSASNIWDFGLLQGSDLVPVITYYNEKYTVKFTEKNILKETSLHGFSELPFKMIPSFQRPFQPNGISLLADYIPLINRYNEMISDEMDIVKIYSKPKVIISNATQKEVDALRAMWKSGIVVSRNNINVQMFEPKGNVYNMEQALHRVTDEIMKVLGLPPAVWGTPEGSINTGVSLTVQYTPTLQIAQTIYKNWRPALKGILSFYLKELEKRNKEYSYEIDGKKKTVKYKELINGNYSVELKPRFRFPRDESIMISNVVNKTDRLGLPRTIALEELGYRSPEDVMTLKAWEDFNPILSPEKMSDMVIKMQQNQMALQEKITALTPPQPTQPSGGTMPNPENMGQGNPTNQPVAPTGPVQPGSVVMPPQ